MKEINVRKIEDAIASMCSEIAVVYNRPIRRALEKAKEAETGERASAVMEMLIENAEIAEKENIPICQDTGMAIVFLKIGQEVHLCGGSLNEAVNRGVERGYGENYLRASVVADPLYERKNTKTNTPAVIYTEVTEGEEVEIEIMAKGFGSENKSKTKMLTPADGVEGVKKFVLDAIREAGPNACPPMVVGVGVGGTFDSCAVMAKKALLRPISQSKPDERYRQLEDELLEAANELNVGPMGQHVKTTAVKIQVEHFPTHIAGLPCAVNICCHVCRHARMVI